MGLDGEDDINSSERASRATTMPPGAGDDWVSVSDWADQIATRISLEQPAQHIAVFVPEVDGHGLRLAAQVWGAGEDTGEIVVGEWVIPLDGTVSGRVHRTGLAALSADVAMDPDYRAFPGGRTRSSLTVPIGPPDDVVGVINLEAPWVSAFSIRDYERMTEHAAAAYATFPGRPGG